MTQEDDATVLTQLGLTKLQAEIFLTLEKLGKSTAKTVGLVSNIDRANVYRVIVSLQKMSLVEKTITKPTLFKAIDIQDAIHMLLRQKANEYKEVEIKTKKIIQNYLKPSNGTLLSDDCQFALIPENLETICKLFNEKSHKSFDLIFYLPAVEGPDMEVRMLFKRLLARNIRVRILTCIKDSNKFSRKQELLKNEKVLHFKDQPNFEVRYTCLDPPITLVLLDDSEALLNTEPFPHGTPSLWTNNSVLVSILRNFFDQQWSNSKKECIDITSLKLKVS
jgi:sugar-specific transcriptional regulator TrmB